MELLKQLEEMEYMTTLKEAKEGDAKDLDPIAQKLKAALGVSLKRYTRKHTTGFRWETPEVSVDVHFAPAVASKKFMGSIYDQKLEDGWLYGGDSAEELLKNMIEATAKGLRSTKAKKFSAEFLEVAKKIAKSK
jgi:hypothetical protein